MNHLPESTLARTDAAAPGAAGRGARISARYWAAVGILALAAVAVHILPGYFAVFLRKEAVPLKAPLAYFDTRKLAPEYERHVATDRSAPMSEDMIQSLGTRDFLQVYLADQAVAPTDGTRVASLFVTYYTGKPDMVPHVPDECYLAGGYDMVSAREVQVPIGEVAGLPNTVPVRVLQFRAPAVRRVASGADTVTVMYFFLTNGRYVTTRDGVRLVLSNPFTRYAFYSKIEVTYFSDDLSRAADEAASLAALPRLLRAVLPVLLRDHIDLSHFQDNAPPAPAAEG